MLDVLIKTHRDPDQIDFTSLWKKATFVFDSNVLLDLYRLPESASNDLIEVLRDDGLRGRIWIGFQVILEFLNNRHEAISDQKNKFNTVRGLLEEAISQYDEVFTKLRTELGKLKLKQRHSLIDPDKFITEENIEKGRSFVEDFIGELSVLEGKQLDVNDLDQIKGVVLEIFDGKIGEGFTKKELDDIYKAGEKRYENNIPPGYKDKSKPGAYTVKDKEFPRKFGDLLLWTEIVRKAKTERLSDIVLVTGDVKEDWWLEKRGKKLGPRKELLNEIYADAPDLQTFYMYDTASFLTHAKSQLKVNIKDSSITQAKDLIEKSRLNRVASEEGLIYLPDIIKLTASRFDGFKAGVGRSVLQLPPLKMKEIALYRGLAEIFDNVRHHGEQKYIGIQAKDRGEFVLLRFKNRVSPALASPEEMLAKSSRFQGAGLKEIQAAMSSEGIDVRTVRTDKSFTTELYIPKTKFSNGGEFTVISEVV
jgi:hypothetical protein